MDEGQFQRLYRNLGRAVWSYSYRVLGNQADADDILQDTFCRYLRSPLVDKDDGEVRAYLFRIASNLIVDHLRRSKYAHTRSTDAEPRIDVAAGEANLTLRRDVARTFRQLKPQERILLWLAYVEGSEHREIAEAVGVKEKSVKVLLFRAKKKLAGLLRRKGLNGRL